MASRNASSVLSWSSDQDSTKGAESIEPNLALTCSSDIPPTLRRAISRGGRRTWSAGVAVATERAVSAARESGLDTTVLRGTGNKRPSAGGLGLHVALEGNVELSLGGYGSV